MNSSNPWQFIFVPLFRNNFFFTFLASKCRKLKAVLTGAISPAIDTKAESFWSQKASELCSTVCIFFNKQVSCVTEHKNHCMYSTVIIEWFTKYVENTTRQKQRYWGGQIEDDMGNVQF